MSPVPWLAVAIGAAAIPPAVLFVMVWRERGEPGARPYAYMLATMVCFSLVYALTLVIPDRGLHELVYPLAAWVKLLVTVPWVLFALEYTGRGRLVTRRLTAGLLAIPLLSSTLLLTSYRDGLLVRDYTIDQRAGVVTSTFENGPVWLVLAVFGFVLLGAGLVMLLEFVVSDRRRYGLQTGLLAVAGLIPGVTTVAHILEVGLLPTIDLTPVAYAAAAVLVAFGLVRWDLFGFVPATRRIGQAAAIDDFGDAVLIVDEDHRLVDLNARASALLGTTRRLVGRPIETLVDAPLDLSSTDETVRLDTERGRRDFDLTVSEIEGPRGYTIGYTLVLHDVTDEKQRRQSFQVLNRVLRHNLRNAMNVVNGYAHQLEAHTDESGEWMLDRIESQSSQLVELSEKARDIDRLTDPSRSHSRFAVTEAIDRVKDELEASHDDVAVTVHVPGGLDLTSNQVVFDSVLRYATECILSYNGTEDPRIVITATMTGASRPRIDVTVTSNGRPVPEADREVIERGEETPLDHNHDLDLWLVSWGVETLGGELSFVADDARPGLTLRIPDLQDDTTEVEALDATRL